MQLSAWYLACIAAGLAIATSTTSDLLDSLASDGVDEPSPIRYNAENVDCPLECTNVANIHSWISYHSTSRLDRCGSPMLLQFSVAQPINDPDTDVLIRCCTIATSTSPGLESQSDDGTTVTENPKMADHLVNSGTTAACVSSGTPTPVSMTLQTTYDDHNQSKAALDYLLDGVIGFFNATENCNENIIFSYHNNITVGVYVGSHLGKSSVVSAITSMSDHLATGSIMPNLVSAQVCDTQRASDRILGITIDMKGDLAGVQKTILNWSEGVCDARPNITTSQTVPDTDIYELPPVTQTSGNKTTAAIDEQAMSWNASARPLLHRRGQCRSIEVSAGDTCGLLKNKCGIGAKDFMTFNPKPSLCSKLQPGDHVCCSAGDPWSPSPPPGPGADGSCAHTQVVSGDSCGTIANRCGINGNDLTKYNDQANFCSGLQPDDYVCCGPGPRYTPPKPKQNADGTCATRLIQNGDTCSSLAKQFNVKIEEIEAWNKEKTWAWGGCKNLLLGYNMCLSAGDAPLPPPQAGTQCGPMKPGTIQERHKALADYNPCPLNACCSNWGYCGPFPAHCDVHSLPGGGPGSKQDGFQTSCISNCGMDIKTNSGPPSTFQRIGYYETWNLDRKCLWQSVEDANTDSSYTHIHWAFLDIDSFTWTPKVTDNTAGKNEWSKFKALTGIKRIASIGGWSASTEPTSYDIIRSAILHNRDAFATNVAQFVNDNGLDGIDFDWEYPGATDILVNGQPIGDKDDGIGYLKFLMVLKSRLASGKTLSISAPASYWYLQNFPIKRIAEVVDYIVYMTYDLHGQWDYGNVNAFDACPSGKCIRSHVNLTEVRNTLAIITKAEVPNNKIFVGEASYGRSFHMAQDGCWGPQCDFTGSRSQSEATPGRCTSTGGYLALAEIDEIIRSGKSTQTFHDGGSNTDVMLYNGDYVGYMTNVTKSTRRSDWIKMNFAGTIDWATDLQTFGNLDIDRPPDASNSGCQAGMDLTSTSGNLCDFACSYGLCPETLCECSTQGQPNALPAVISTDDWTAWDTSNVDMISLCKFNCKYGGSCDDSICTQPVIDTEIEEQDDDNNIEGNDRAQNSDGCVIYSAKSMRQQSKTDCYNTCKAQFAADNEDESLMNWSCVGLWPGQPSIPWVSFNTQGFAARCNCSCNSWALDELADDFIDAMTAVGEVACVSFMSVIEEFVKVGLDILPGRAGEVIGTAADVAISAVQMANYLYPSDQDPKGAFDWWLSPCGDTSKVPDDVWNFWNSFDQVVDIGTSFDSKKSSMKAKKGSGHKGDPSNPLPAGRGQPRPRRPPKGGKPGGKPGGTSGDNGVKKKSKKCRIRAGKSTTRLGGDASNTLRLQSCVDETTRTTEYVVTTLHRKVDATPTKVTRTCGLSGSQGCYHYSSAIRGNSKWAALSCPPEAATTAYRLTKAKATATWSLQHDGEGWQKPMPDVQCERDEFPPAYLLNEQSLAFTNSGKDISGQLVRWIPHRDNSNAGQTWKSACIGGVLGTISDTELLSIVKSRGIGRQVVRFGEDSITFLGIDVDSYAEVVLNFAHAENPPNDGLNDNPCWPKERAPKDPGFVLLTYDPYYKGMQPPYDYRKKYVPGSNGG